MGERYSILRPLSTSELHRLTVNMWNFFSPLNAHKIQELLDIPQTTEKIQPFSLMEFMTYLKKSDPKVDPYRCKNQIICLAKKLSDQGILIHAGQKKASPGLGQCYYAMKELTSLQDGSNFWLGGYSWRTISS